MWHGCGTRLGISCKCISIYRKWCCWPAQIICVFSQRGDLGRLGLYHWATPANENPLRRSALSRVNRKDYQTILPNLTPLQTIEIHLMPKDVARMWHEIALPCHDWPMSDQDPYEHFTFSWAEFFMKILAWTVFVMSWVSVIFTVSIIGILIMIPVSFIFYKFIYKADVISNW